MTVVLDMRDRIAAAAQVELRNRGLAAGADIAYAIADRALDGTSFANLTAYVDAVEQGGTLAEINARIAGSRGELRRDPIFSELVRFEEP